MEPSLWITPFQAFHCSSTHWDCMWQCLGTASLCVLWDDNSLFSTYGHWTEMVGSSPITEFLGDIICCRICVLYQQTQTWSPSWPALWPFSLFYQWRLPCYCMHSIKCSWFSTKEPSVPAPLTKCPPFLLWMTWHLRSNCVIPMCWLGC